MKKIISITVVLCLLFFTACKKEKKTDPKPKPIAGFSYSTPGNAPASVSFTNTSQNAESYIWDFGDATSSTEKEPVHIFQNPGTYTVKLTAINSEGTSTASNDITVTKKPDAPIASFINSSPGYAPTTITFTNKSLNATSYFWEFGDNGTSTETNPQHFYNLASTYNVKLTATGPGGVDTYTNQIIITDKPIVYNNCKIIKVTITGLPLVDGSGAGWDGSGAPDIFVKILSGTTELLNTTTSRYNDNTTYPKSWNLTTPITISNLTILHKIEVWDYDWPDADDLIGTLNFTPSNYTTYPSTVNLVSGSSKVTLDLQWF